ncbi:membrane protein insertase, YidC/Oxa1 family [Thermoclostridium stercorarium subsp. stercorarium DSM 8532]|jgi:YidC/Oxa1 family membrane protein insertase|uniref:Membrane protein insertase, YidC/Oxa1 family n=1 Tax=Thermoclostridium stercorarium (strain ATCC 35414 / DSM 8532 / NCIMB 11754) TaxID=1121335 RepID=L7VT03_THES1|nr:YidC/Oxa1 family membrane protein insertase [Thermoclostridium stercorarium]AGC69719.1 membrane protein insertase, YidC/Oxa1 family [Thermoclostridium stercorarium subsp. stercorarium DSM 8532]AGI40669.1 YidC [Thermoclostridium stercorarium subsp. stercorarium DSM 8532]UZQ85649.1 YidC/Oxa1 family membrane protein insertase [Thermoclostridium stercorarium]
MMSDAIARVLGRLLYIIYKTIAFQNYGIALILFTLIVKLILLPLTIKQIRSSQKISEMQPEIDRIQKRYKNDKEKLNQELAKLYQEKGVNPLSGCLPLFIQFPIIVALYYTIRKPLTYMLGWTKEFIGNIIIKIMEIQPQFFQGSQYSFINQFESVKSDPVAVANLFERNPYFEINVVDAINTIPELMGEGIEKISLNFLGIFNLGVKPTYDFNLIFQNPGLYLPALFMVLLAVATTFLSTKLSMKQMNQNSNSQVAQTNNTLLYFGPIMTLIIGFQAPVGLALYWTVSNLFQMAQQYFLDKYVYKKKEE